MSAANTAAITYSYDELYRMTTKKLSVSSIVSLTAEYEYTNTTQVKSYTSTVSRGVSELENSYSYAYNNSGNIVRIVDGNDQAIVYQYDDVGQLVRENNEPLGETYVYTYDNAGNRTSKTTYAYTTDSVNDLTPTETIEYGYGTGDWGDRLVLIKTNNLITDIFSYDAVGNPTIYSGYTMTWDGRRLMRMQKSSADISFTYNVDGIRTSKTVNGVEHIYTLEGSRIVSESWGDNLLIYLYDESGAPIGMQYRTDSYAANRFDTFYFEKNLFGDIVAVYNSSGIKVISYTYDAWGNHTVTWHDSYSTNFNAYYNPFRYRGYYYDTDTGFYYLQSRYYNPQWGRFLNADGYVSTGQGLLGYNMYAYCNNNPVMLVDTTGKIPFLAVTAAIGAIAGAIVGGIIASETGGNIWAGVAIGAVAGGLIGTGVGAAAGAALAGSVVASTAAVAAGGGTLLTTISTSGLGAGVVFLGNNLSQAANSLTTTSPAVTPSVQQALKKLDASGLRPGQTTISQSKILEIVNNFDPVKAESRITTINGTRFVFDGHHTTVASTILDRGTCMNMGITTNQLPSATNVYWTKHWYEFWKTAIKIVE